MRDEGKRKEGATGIIYSQYLVGGLKNSGHDRPCETF